MVSSCTMSSCANLFLRLAPPTRPCRVCDEVSVPMNNTCGSPTTCSCTLESRSASSLHLVDGRAACDAFPSVALACDANPSVHSSTRRRRTVTRRMQWRKDASEAATTTSSTRVEGSRERQGRVKCLLPMTWGVTPLHNIVLCCVVWESPQYRFGKRK